MSRAVAAAGNKRSSAIATAGALVFVVLWASAYVPSKIGSTHAPPYWFLAVRFALAAALLSAVVIATKRPMPRSGGQWATYVVLGLLANAGYLGLTYTALEYGLASGVGAIVASMNPLLLAAVAPWVLHEPLTRAKAAGLVLGFIGVLAIVLARGSSGTAAPPEVALAVAGVCASVLSTIGFKRTHVGGDLVAFTAVGFVASALLMFACGLAFEGPFPAVALADPTLVSAMLYLVLVMSVGASLLWFWLLSQGEASRVSAYYFLTPAFGLGFGTLLLGEHFHASDVFGLTAIAAGILLVQRVR